MKPRECWSVLLNKAERRVKQAQADLAHQQQTQQSLQQSLTRVEQLYGDYRTQAQASDSASQGMQDALNHRQFLSQLDQLRLRLSDELTKSARSLQLLRQAVIEAERERMKMQSLLDEDLQRQRQRASAREQKSLDELGVRQYNLRLS